MAGIYKAVVDTGPLFSILVLKYSLKLKPRAAEAVIDRSRISPYLRARSEQASMVDLFDGIQIIMTSSHVIGELQGLQRLKRGYQRDFWLFAMRWLSEKGLDEQLVCLLDLNADSRWQNSICEIGPTDTGLLEIAFREGAVLLTDDKDTLARSGWAQGIDCRLVETLL
jgi:hypothetical protein